ncbi:MAG: SURF1 family protein [Candidatus Berkiella sp.]
MIKYRWVFKPRFRITLVTLLGVTLLCSLGVWQLMRKEQKITLQQQAAIAITQAPLDKAALLAAPTQRYALVELKGTFLNQYSILLDNKIKNGQVGYHLVTPIALTETQWLLVDRGFIPAGPSRSQLPKIPSILGEVTIEGYLDFSYRNPFISNPLETQNIQWPLRMQHLDLPLLGSIWHKEIFPMLVILDAKPTHISLGISPAKHQGYAVQWFGLSLTLFFFYLFSHLRREEHHA